jgi:hypothetical protein
VNRNRECLDLREKVTEEWRKMQYYEVHNFYYGDQAKDDRIGRIYDMRN